MLATQTHEGFSARADIALRDFRADPLGGGFKFPNGATRLTEALSDETQAFFTRTSLEQIVRSVIQQLVAAGATLPQLGAQKQGAAPVQRKKTSATPADYGLTRRETEVLRVLAQGKSNKEIGRELNMAQGTVKVHMRAVCEKLNVARRTEAIVLVNKMGLLDAG